jgi:hypothetical protein
MTYDPRSGNLLLDVVVRSSRTTNGSRSFVAGEESLDSSRAFNDLATGLPRTDGLSLRTQFSEVAATPEPATVLLFAGGLIIATARRRYAGT